MQKRYLSILVLHETIESAIDVGVRDLKLLGYGKIEVRDGLARDEDGYL